MASIRFFAEDIFYKPAFSRRLAVWIREAILSEGKQPGNINYIFCSDDYLLSINQQYLSHDTLTDIVTFDNSEDPTIIEGDIFISVDRIQENAVTFKTTFEIELKRVLIHGVLHLIGYTDKNEVGKKRMREKEDAYISLWLGST
jgi:probable rRNA maturation factor